MKKTLLISLFALFTLSAFSQTRILNGLKIGRKNSSTVVKIDSVSTDGTNIKFYKGSTILSPVTADTVSFSSIGVYKADSNYRKPGSYTSRYDFKTEATNENTLKAWKSFGSTNKLVPMCPLTSTATLTLVDGRSYYTLYHVPDSITLTGFKYVVSTAGSYTADQYNGIAIYSVSGVTITKMSETVTDGSIWAATANTVAVKALPAPILLVPGYYIVGMVWNASATTTAPIMPSYSAAIYTLGQGFANGYNLCNYMNSPQNTLVTPITSTSGFYGTSVSVPLIIGY